MSTIIAYKVVTEVEEVKTVDPEIPEIEDDDQEETSGDDG